jgi:hypothetical protein
MRKAISVVALAAAFTLAIPTAAHAVRDSGVQLKGCSGTTFGQVTAYMRGSGNLWAPGDWDHRPAWRDSGNTFKNQSSRSTSTGGGYWRVYVNDTYNSVSTGCFAGG